MPNVNSHWLGPSSISSERSGNPSASIPLRRMLEDRIDLIEARFGQILKALRDQLTVRRLARPGGVGGREPRVLDLEQMEFDFEPGRGNRNPALPSVANASRASWRVENGTGLPLVK